VASSIREVAKEANVSLSTVSKVLNGRRDAKFTVATRARVAAAASRVGYHPSAVARGLAGKRMNAVGVIMAYSQNSVTSDPYLGPCLDGILRVNKDRSQKTVLFTEESWTDALKQLPFSVDGHCDGLPVIIPRTDSKIVDELTRRDSCFVLVGDSRRDSGKGTADVDNVRAARQLVSYLIGLGHRRIAAFCGNPDFFSSNQRLEGYRQGLRGAELTIRADYIFSGEYDAESGARSAEQFLTRFAKGNRERPTAIFCFNDAIARGAVTFLRTQGIEIPQELSIIGFDDNRHAICEEPHLATMRQDVRQVGKRATEVLLDCIEGRQSPQTHIALPAERIVRATTAPPVPPA
jgi:DNA-binding LacI/PurR family transcriptional regulator